MNKIFLDEDVILTESDVIALVQQHEGSAELARLNTLEKYFKAQNTSILGRSVTNGVDNAKIASGYCRYITNTINGYFLGSKNSVVYTYPEGFDESKLRDLFRYNDERAINNKLGENMSVYGYAVEQIYIDKTGNFRFAAISPKNVIIIFEDNIDQDIHSVIKYRSTEMLEPGAGVSTTIVRHTVDYYTKDKVYTWIYENGIFVACDSSEMENIFSDVPFIYYENANEMGDFEPVLCEVDAYDRTLSDMSNLFDYFNDAYLVFTGADLEVTYDALGNEINPMIAMRQNKCFTLPSGATAQFLAKPNISSDAVTFMDVLRNDIHKFSHVPDISDEKFFGSSGIALEYKLQPLEYLCGIKESNFCKGLTRRLELLCNYLSLKNADFDFSTIEIAMNRNTIADLGSVYDTILKLHGIISDESLLEQLPNVDKDIELQRLQEQKERNIEEFGLPNNNNEPLNMDKEEEDEEVVEE